jgi:hypothetical protein
MWLTHMKKVLALSGVKQEGPGPGPGVNQQEQADVRDVQLVNAATDPSMQLHMHRLGWCTGQIGSRCKAMLSGAPGIVL